MGSQHHVQVEAAGRIRGAETFKTKEDQANKASDNYRYYVIFDKARMDGALNIHELIERLKNLSNIFMIQPRLFVYISHFAFTIFCLVIVCLNNDIDAKMFSNMKEISCLRLREDFRG